jgi:hypothetical protein
MLHLLSLLQPGLPDGIFSNKKPIWVNFGGSGKGRCQYILQSFGLLCGHLVYFMGFWFICWLFGIFFRFGMLYKEKSGNPDCSSHNHNS